MSDQSMRIGRLIQLNDKTFVTGLSWWALSKPQTAKKEMLQHSQEKDLNFGLIYSGNALQGGLARVPAAEMKAFEGAWSLAGVLSTKLIEEEVQTWVGIFRLDDGNFAVVAVRDGKIVPGCDLVGGFEEVRGLARSMSSQANWQKVFITDPRFASDYPSANVDDRQILQILGADKKWDSSLRIRRLGGGINPKVMLGGLVVILAISGLIGWKFYADGVAAREAEEAIERDNAAQNAKRMSDIQKAQALVNERTIKPSWPNEPSASDVVAMCRAAFARVPTNIAGWELYEVSCGQSTLQAKFKRLPGTTMAIFNDAASALRDGKQITSFNVLADEGSIRIMRTDMPARGEEEISTLPSWSMGWLSYFQSLDIPMQLVNKPHPDPIPPEKSVLELLGKEKAVPPPPWWNTYIWKFTSEGVGAIDVLTPLLRPEVTKGLVVKKILMTPKDKGLWAWSAEGEIHVKP